LDINLTGNYISKDEMIILDIINNNKWKRPIYFAVTVGREKYLNLQEYFQAEGFAYRLVPIKTKVKEGQIGRVSSNLMYNNIINKFKWGNMNDPKVYLDENNMRMSMNIRNNFVRLADQLVVEGRTDSAVAVLDRCNELVPNKKVPYNYFNLLMAEAYYKAAQFDMHKMGKERTSMEVNMLPAAVKKGNEVVKQMVENNEKEILYYLSLEPKFRDSVTEDLQRAFYLLQELGTITEQYGEKDLSKEINAKLASLFSVIQPEKLNTVPK
jgi:tetratricopeptide (TPR) repeat protein